MNYSPRYGRFRALLRQIREEAGFNQTTLAQKLGKPQTFISKSELGERRMDFLETLDFCAACGVSANQLIEQLQQGVAETAKARKKRQSPRHMDSEGRLTRRENSGQHPPKR